MNIAAVITAAVFLAFASGILIFLFAGKTALSTSIYKNFFRASCGVYVSGALLVFIFTLIMKGLPVAFVIISDITITLVFCFTVRLIFFMTRSIVEAAKKAQEQKQIAEENKSDNDENKD